MDPAGFARKLLPIRIEDCPRPGILALIVSIDLFGIDTDAARERLLSTIAAIRSGRAKPVSAPSFPSRQPTSTTSTASPVFPGVNTEN
jgi:hypothetical protein